MAIIFYYECRKSLAVTSIGLCMCVRWRSLVFLASPAFMIAVLVVLEGISPTLLLLFLSAPAYRLRRSSPRCVLQKIGSHPRWSFFVSYSYCDHYSTSLPSTYFGNPIVQRGTFVLVLVVRVLRVPPRSLLRRRCVPCMLPSHRFRVGPEHGSPSMNISWGVGWGTSPPSFGVNHKKLHTQDVGVVLGFVFWRLLVLQGLVVHHDGLRVLLFGF